MWINLLQLQHNPMRQGPHFVDEETESWRGYNIWLVSGRARI